MNVLLTWYFNRLILTIRFCDTLIRWSEYSFVSVQDRGRSNNLKSTIAKHTHFWLNQVYIHIMFNFGNFCPTSATSAFVIFLQCCIFKTLKLFLAPDNPLFTPPIVTYKTIKTLSISHPYISTIWHIQFNKRQSSQNRCHSDISNITFLHIQVSQLMALHKRRQSGISNIRIF